MAQEVNLEPNCWFQIPSVFLVQDEGEECGLESCYGWSCIHQLLYASFKTMEFSNARFSLLLWVVVSSYLDTQVREGFQFDVIPRYKKIIWMQKAIKPALYWTLTWKAWTRVGTRIRVAWILNCGRITEGMNTARQRNVKNLDVETLRIKLGVGSMI